MVQLFLKHRPELATLANVGGATCTHIAAAKGSGAVIRELLKFNQGGVSTLHNKVSDVIWKAIRRWDQSTHAFRDVIG